MGRLPMRYENFMETCPPVGKACRKPDDSIADAGLLNAKVRSLMKLGISLEARLDAGAAPVEIRHAVVQATARVGFPAMMAGPSWFGNVLEEASNG